MTTAVETVAVRTRPAWWDITRFVLLFLLLMFVYEAARDFVAPAVSATAPFEHADQVMSAERALGLQIEDEVQRVVHDTPGGEFVTTWFYTLAYTAGYILFFVWLFVRHRANFAFVFTWFWVTNAVAVLVYWLYPLAPPRFIEGLGVDDPTKEALQLGGSLEWFQPFRNEFAAMPSMHVGQTILYAVAIVWLLRSPWRWSVWMWPAMMLLTVMATANHFWLDGVGGAICVLAALGITTLFVRRGRPWERTPA